MDMDEKELKVPCQDKSLLWGGQNYLKYKYAYAVIADALANSIDNVWLFCWCWSIGYEAISKLGKIIVKSLHVLC